MGEKTQIGVQIDADVWKTVRVKSIQEGITAGEIVNQALIDYLGKSKQKPTSSPAASPVSPASDPTEVERFVLDHADKSARQVAEMLNEQGFTSSRGGAFNMNIVGKMRQKLK